MLAGGASDLLARTRVCLCFVFWVNASHGVQQGGVASRCGAPLDDPHHRTRPPRIVNTHGVKTQNTKHPHPATHTPTTHPPPNRQTT